MRPARSLVVQCIGALVVAAVLAAVIVTFVLQSFLVQGASMLPSLHDGERVLVDKITYRFREPQRGEVVVFRYPADASRKFIKRVIGLPGDVVEVRAWTVYVNGRPLHEEYILGPTYREFGPAVVPEGTLFVMGDNRNQSEDSRDPSVGFVPQSLVVGRAILTYWPPDQFGWITVPDVFREFGP